MTDYNTKRYLSCVETAKLLRERLKKEWPTVKFSVRSDQYSGGASIDVSYTDGPPQKKVEAVTCQYNGATFDGMIDLKSYHDSVIEIDGKKERVHFGADFIFVRRNLSPETKETVKAKFQKKWGAEWSRDWRDNLGQYRGLEEFNEIAEEMDITPKPTEKTKAAPAMTIEQGPMTITHEGKWTWVAFPEKPDHQIICKLKELGARFSGKRCAWYFTRRVENLELI